VTKVVRAAGGVVRREHPEGPLFAIVHRPRYDDWSFPKGKLGVGESDADAARREVEEETGMRCDLERELAPVRYIDRRGRPKVVRYWLMRPTAGAFAPNAEVDELRWAARSEALRLLSYAHDRRLLASLEQPP
jgi:8-oxo-dGTP diphosphatase